MYNDYKIKVFKELINQKTIRPEGDIYDVLTVSNTGGFIKQLDYFENRIIASEDKKNYKIVSKNDFAYNPARINVGSIARLKRFNNGIVSPMYLVFAASDSMDPNYLEHFFHSSSFSEQMNKLLSGSVRKTLDFSSLEKIEIKIYKKDIQKTFGSYLEVLDKLIEIKKSKINNLEELKSHVIRQLLNFRKRFNEFKDDIHEARVSDVCDYEQPGEYIVKSENYYNEGTPVLTANKGFILGYTKELDGIYKKGECFIFDDFTLDTKYIDFEFKVKSSAIKIITAKGDNNIKFIHESIKNKKHKMMGHNRHWISLVSKDYIKITSLKEQIKISNFISKIEKLIMLESNFINNVQKFKKHYLSKIY